MSEMVVERIVYDSEFWGRMHPKLKTFYFGSMLQELASLRYPLCKVVQDNATN